MITQTNTYTTCCKLLHCISVKYKVISGNVMLTKSYIITLDSVNE